jgi:hypothetical protein
MFLVAQSDPLFLCRCSILLLSLLLLSCLVCPAGDAFCPVVTRDNATENRRRRVHRYRRRRAFLLGRCLHCIFLLFVQRIEF